MKDTVYWVISGGLLGFLVGTYGFDNGSKGTQLGILFTFGFLVIIRQIKIKPMLPTFGLFFENFVFMLLVWFLFYGSDELPNLILGNLLFYSLNFIDYKIEQRKKVTV
jgi:hypothetical protein